MDAKTLRKREGLLAVGIFLSSFLFVWSFFLEEITFHILELNSDIFRYMHILFWLCIYFMPIFFIIFFILSLFFNKHLPNQASGRISRLPFAKWIIVLSIGAYIVSKFAMLLLSWIVSKISNAEAYSAELFLLGYIIFMGTFTLVILPAVNQRLKDCNYSKHLAWLYLIPGINIFFHIFLSLKPGTIGENKYGPDPLEMKDEASVLS